MPIFSGREKSNTRPHGANTGVGPAVGDPLVILLDAVCDGHSDCADGSDETDTTCANLRAFLPPPSAEETRQIERDVAGVPSEAQLTGVCPVQCLWGEPFLYRSKSPMRVVQ